MINANYFIPMNTNGQFLIQGCGVKRTFDTESVDITPVIKEFIEQDYVEKIFKKKKISHNNHFLVVKQNNSDSSLEIGAAQRSGGFPSYHYFSVGKTSSMLIEKAVNEGFVINTERDENNQAVYLHKHRIKDNSEIESLTITCTEKGLVFSKELKTFTALCCWTKRIFQDICWLISVYQEKEFPYLDKFRDAYYDYLKSQGAKEGYTAYENIKFIANFATKDFLSFMEYAVKAQEEYNYYSLIEALNNANPSFTGKPYPSIKAVSSKAGQKILAAASRSSDIREIQEAINSLESNPQVGPDGLTIINEFFEIVGYYDIGRELSNLAKIFDTFEITPAVFINRAIKSFFYEGIQCWTYFRLAVDYARMHNVLEIPIPKKLPLNLSEEHDYLCTQIRQKEIANCEESFKKIAQKHFPEVERFNKEHEDNEYIVKIPQATKELVIEGQSLNHCVASYAPSMASGETLIFFVRTKENPDKPFVTFEVKNKILIQAHGFNNSAPTKEVRDFIDNFIKTL